MRKSRIFCKGICNIWERKHRKCIKCGVYLCGVCELEYRKIVYCINCFLKDYNISRLLKEEYLDMLEQLEKRKKTEVKQKYIIVTKNET